MPNNDILLEVSHVSKQFPVKKRKLHAVSDVSLTLSRGELLGIVGESGLLICGECGCNYRRITRSSGEIVWRCANRVEHGKLYCQESPTISEQKVKDELCDALKLADYDEAMIKDHIEHVVVGRDGSLEIEIRQQTIAQILSW